MLYVTLEQRALYCNRCLSILALRCVYSGSVPMMACMIQNQT